MIDEGFRNGVLPILGKYTPKMYSNELPRSSNKLVTNSNQMPVMGNYTPKTYSNGMVTASSLVQSSNQIIYRKLPANNVDKLSQTRKQAASDEFIFKKNSSVTGETHQPNKTFNLNHSMSNLSEFEFEQHDDSVKRGLKRISRETSHLYASNNFNSQFILLKPDDTADNKENNKNLKMYEKLNAQASGGKEADKIYQKIYSRIEHRQPASTSFELNDVYF